MEPCDYGCAYCFAVLSDRHHRHKAEQRGKPTAKIQSGLKPALSLIKDYKTRNTLKARLMQMGYPILMSNRTDPFGRMNRAQSMPTIELLVEMGFKIAFQTKGFVNPGDLPRLLEIIPSSCFYISIAFDDDDMRKRIEPGAPSLGDRYRLIETLVEHGHSVSVGLNPYVKGWVKNEDAFLKHLKGLGVHGVWVEVLHLSNDQVKQMSEREKNALGADVIAMAKRRSPSEETWEDFFTIRQRVIDAELELFSAGQCNHSEFWDPYKERYKCFPVLQDFVNWCQQTKSDGDLIYFNEFRSMLAPELPELHSSVGRYIASTSRQVVRERGKAWSNDITYLELLKWLWVDARISGSPGRTHGFQYAQQGGKYIFDGEGLPMLVWNPIGSRDGYYREV